jgi:hypothetical protein
MQKHTITSSKTALFASALLLFSFLFLPAGKYPKAYALQNPTNPSGTDFFVLIDQTSSMAVNDPQKLRVDTAKYLVDYFAFYAANHPEENNRISIIDFGAPSTSSGLLTLPVTNTLDQDQSLEQIKNGIVSKSLNEANISTVFNVVDNDLKSAQNVGDGRRKVLVLITDGNPVADRSDSKTDLSLKFDEVEKQLSILKENNPGQWDTFIFGIYPQEVYWSKIVGPYWKKISTGAFQIDQLNDMKSNVVREIGPALGYAGRVYSAQEGFLVQPYLDQVKLSISKYLPDSDVTVQYQEKNGQPITLDPNAKNVTRFVSSNYETWTIKDPPAGIWKVGSGSSRNLDVFIDQTPGGISLTFPQSARPLNIPFYFRMDMPEYKIAKVKYPITWNVTLVDPKGTKIPLEISPVSGSSFRANKAFLPTAVGDYKVSIQASTQFDEGSDPYVLYSGEYGFSVVDVKYRLDPAPPYLQYEPISRLNLFITDHNDLPIEVDPDAKMNLALLLHLPNGEVHTYPFKGSNGAYYIDEPILLTGNGEKSFEINATDDAANQLFVKKFPVEAFQDIQLVSPPERVPQNSSLSDIEIKLLDENHVAFDPSSNYGLRLDVTVIPSASENPVSGRLEYDPEKESFVASFPSLPTKSLGNNLVKVVGVVNVNGKETPIFEMQLGYSVITELPYFRVLSPSLNEKQYRLYSGIKKVGVPIEIQWVKGNGPIDPSTEFINKPADLVTVSLLKDGKPVFKDLKLTQLSANDPSRWGTTVTDLSSAGKYVAVFNLNNAMLVSQQPYMQFEPIEVQFTLAEVATQRWLRFGGIFIAVLLVSIVGVRERNERKGPYPKGTLTVIEHNIGTNTSIGEINLMSSKRRTVKWRLKDKKMQSLGIKQMNIRQLKGRRGVQTDGIEIEAFDNNGRHYFTMQFNRGASEKRIPRKAEQSPTFYSLAYTPPEPVRTKPSEPRK